MSDSQDQKKADEAPKGKKKLLLPAIVLAVVLLGFGYMTMGKSKAQASEGEGEKARSGEVEEKEEVVPGEVVSLPAVTLNLADGGYLKVGLALQLVEGAHPPEAGHGAGDPVTTWAAPAYDAAIEVFGRHTTLSLVDPAHRRQVKKHLTKEISERYHHEVMGLYFTEFVTQ